MESSAPPAHAVANIDAMASNAHAWLLQTSVSTDHHDEKHQHSHCESIAGTPFAERFNKNWHPCTTFGLLLLQRLRVAMADNLAVQTGVCVTFNDSNMANRTYRKETLTNTCIVPGMSFTDTQLPPQFRRALNIEIPNSTDPLKLLVVFQFVLDEESLGTTCAPRIDTVYDLPRIFASLVSAWVTLAPKIQCKKQAVDTITTREEPSVVSAKLSVCDELYATLKQSSASSPLQRAARVLEVKQSNELLASMSEPKLSCDTETRNFLFNFVNTANALNALEEIVATRTNEKGASTIPATYALEYEAVYTLIRTFDTLLDHSVRVFGVDTVRVLLEHTSRDLTSCFTGGKVDFGEQALLRVCAQTLHPGMAERICHLDGRASTHPAVRQLAVNLLDHGCGSPKDTGGSEMARRALLTQQTVHALVRGLPPSVTSHAPNPTVTAGDLVAFQLWGNGLQAPIETATNTEYLTLIGQDPNWQHPFLGTLDGALVGLWKDGRSVHTELDVRRTNQGGPVKGEEVLHILYTGGPLVLSDLSLLGSTNQLIRRALSHWCTIHAVTRVQVWAVPGSSAKTLSAMAAWWGSIGFDVADKCCGPSTKAKTGGQSSVRTTAHQHTNREPEEALLMQLVCLDVTSPTTQ
jgi:hypothetical protein